MRCDDSVTRILDAASRRCGVARVRSPADPAARGLSVFNPGRRGQFKGRVRPGAGNENAFLVPSRGGSLIISRRNGCSLRDIDLYQELFQVVPRLDRSRRPPRLCFHKLRMLQIRGGFESPGWRCNTTMRTWPVAWPSTAWTSRRLAFSFDGTGMGTDGRDLGRRVPGGGLPSRSPRAAHLRYVGMPGGDKAVREPWRMAAAHLLDAGCGLSVLRSGLAPAPLRIVETMLEKRVNTPLTSSVGRLFDAVASIAGVRQTASYEGQPAMQLEWLATGIADAGVYPFEVTSPPEVQGTSDGRKATLASNGATSSLPDVAGFISSAEGDLIDVRPLIWRAVCN